MNLKDYCEFDLCDKTKIWLNNNDEPVQVTAEICQLGLFCNLTELTENNLYTWLHRFFLAQGLGIFLGATLTIKDLESHVGLKLKTPYKSTRDWWKSMTQTLYDETKKEAAEVRKAKEAQ